MNFIHTLIIACCIGIASAAEDQNITAFIKAFPSANPLESKPEDTVQHYTIDANISVKDFAEKISKILNAKVSIHSANEPRALRRSENYKDTDSAYLLVSGDFMCLIFKNKDSDKNYNVAVVKADEFSVKPDTGGAIRPGGKESNIDMRLPSSTKEPKK